MPYLVGFAALVLIILALVGNLQCNGPGRGGSSGGHASATSSASEVQPIRSQVAPVAEVPEVVPPPRAEPPAPEEPPPPRDVTPPETAWTVRASGIYGAEDPDQGHTAGEAATASVGADHVVIRVTSSARRRQVHELTSALRAAGVSFSTINVTE